jgi:inner membrane protein
VSGAAARSGLTGLAGIGALDAVRSARQWPVPVLAALDWPAHLLTAALLLAALSRRPDPRLAGWALAGSVAIDLDHLPRYLAVRGALVQDDRRPVTHSLTTPALLATAALVARGEARTALTGLAAGVLLHFVRDLGTGGVPLLWPLRRRTVRVPYGVYAAATAAAARLARRPLAG